MRAWHRSLLSVCIAGALGLYAVIARAEESPTPAPAAAAPPPKVEEEAKPKQPGRGDFDAGGQVRLPSGPDEMGQYATFNWVAVDVKGTYFLLDSVTVNGHIPIALVKPDRLMTGQEPSMFGGFSVTLDAKLPKGPFAPTTYETEARLLLGGSYMREGALLLGEKDFPLFTGDFQPGLTAGLGARVTLSSLVDFSLQPVWVYQSANEGSLTAVQIPTSLILRLGSVVQVSADLGIYTGDDYSFGAEDGGRIAAGGALTVKVGPLLLHAGAGAASLLTGGMYPTISDSFYIDLDVKYAK
jgi:hypothetical protein